MFNKEEIVRNFLHVIDSSIDDKFKFRFDFQISINVGKLLKVKEFRRKDTTTIIANNETQI